MIEQNFSKQLASLFEQHQKMKVFFFRSNCHFQKLFFAIKMIGNIEKSKRNRLLCFLSINNGNSNKISNDILVTIKQHQKQPSSLFQWVRAPHVRYRNRQLLTGLAMSLAYIDHQRTRFWRTHEEIFDFRRTRDSNWLELTTSRKEVCHSKKSHHIKKCCSSSQRFIQL